MEFGNHDDDDEFPFQRDAVDAVNESKDLLTADGWEEQAQGFWRKRFSRAATLPLPKAPGIVRRTVYDADRGAVIDEARWPRSSQGFKSGKLHRRLRQRHDLEVELEVSNVNVTPQMQLPLDRSP